MLNNIDQVFGLFVKKLESILFFKLGAFPIIIIVLLLGAFIFTIYFKFININNFQIFLI